MRALLYARVSTAEQSCEPQLQELRAHAQLKGWTVLGEFTDVMSGTIDSRPGLMRMMERAVMGGVDAVVCVKIDRIARSVPNFSKIVTSLEAIKVALVCTSQGIDTSDSNPCGALMRNILSAFAAFERDLISERTKAGLAVARAAGRIGGRKRIYDYSSPKNREVVRQWLSEGGKNWKELRERLGGIGYSTVYRIMKAYQDNPVKEKAPKAAPQRETLQID